MSPLTAIITIVGSVLTAWGGAWISGAQSAQSKISEVRLEASQLVGAEQTARTKAIERLEGRFTAQEDKLDAIIDGLGIKYTLPKAETFNTKEERIINKAHLIEGTKKDGAPLNENEKTDN